ncbi:MAG: restriction endonuclease subunit S [Planktothrix sp.]
MSSYKLSINNPQLPEGYKPTEVGVIPEDWEVKPLGNLIDRLESGISVNSVEKDKGESTSEESVLKTSSVLNGHFFPGECKRIIQRDIRRAKINPQENTIIISRMNTPDLVGECGYVEKDYPYLFLPDRLWITRFKKDIKVSVRWLAYILSYGNFNKAIKNTATGTSGSMKNIAKDKFLQITITYPQKEEQETIAQALSDVDALIAALDKLIAKKRHIKTATMQQLLTGKTRLPGFGEGKGYKKTDIGVIPEDWEVFQLQDLTEKSNPITYGVLKPGDYIDGGIPLLQIKDVIHGEIKIEELHRITPQLDSQYCRTRLCGGEIVISLVGTIGKVAYIKNFMQGANLHRNLAKISVSNKNVVKFIFYQLESFRVQSDIKLTTFGSTQSLLNLSDLRSLLIVIPPLPEQRAIAQVLSDIETEISALEKRRTKTQAIKQGMMQELLTGRTRLSFNKT